MEKERMTVKNETLNFENIIHLCKCYGIEGLRIL